MPRRRYNKRNEANLLNGNIRTHVGVPKDEVKKEEDISNSNLCTIPNIKEEPELNMKSEVYFDKDEQEDLEDIKSVDQTAISTRCTSKEQLYTCHHCGLVCELLVNLEEHIKLRHLPQLSKRQRVKRCHHCTIITNMKNRKRCFKRHACSFRPRSVKCVQVHSTMMQDMTKQFHSCPHSKYRIKPHSCPYCEYRSTQAGNVKHHVMAKHEKLKPHFCPHCDFSCAHSPNLQFHIIAKHDKTKPFSCPYCIYSCAHSSNLQIHIMARHYGYKPYACSQCDFRAVNSGNLKAHVMAKHDVVKPHSCAYCDYKCVNPGNLRTHIVSKHLWQIPKDPV